MNITIAKKSGRPRNPTNFFNNMLSKKITRGLPNLTKNFKPRGPDRMGQPSRALHFGVIKAEGNPKVIAQRVRKIYIKALAAKKKAGR